MIIGRRILALCKASLIYGKQQLGTGRSFTDFMWCCVNSMAYEVQLTDKVIGTNAELKGLFEQ